MPRLALEGVGSFALDVLDAQAQKRSAMAFYDLMFNENRPREAVERYVGAEYIQHNPEVADGKEAFVEYFERMAAEFPGKRVEFKRAIAEGSTWSCTAARSGPATRATPGSTSSGSTTTEIVEHWDVLQVVPSVSANDNGSSSGGYDRRPTASRARCGCGTPAGGSPGRP